jgi:hypothetical protein
VLGGVLAAIALALAPAPARAEAAIAEHFCQKPVRSDAVSYGVQGSGVRCNFIHFWTVRWLDHRGEPKGWSCVDIGESGKCHRRSGGAYFEYYSLD